MRLEGNVILVTGGGTGIGSAVAERFAREGAKVIITGRREEKLRTTTAAIQSPYPVRYYPADVSQREQVKALIEWVLQEYGQIDILINSAGVNIRERSMEKLSPDNWDLLMRVNSDGVYNTMYYTLPHMRARQWGTIINIVSVAGLRANPVAGVAYCASKSAVTALTKTAALEERFNNIRISAIYPGEVDTPMLDERPEPLSPEHRARILRPMDVAEAALFIAALPQRVSIPELVIKPIMQEYS